MCVRVMKEDPSGKDSLRSVTAAVEAFGGSVRNAASYAYVTPLLNETKKLLKNGEIEAALKRESPAEISI